MLPGEAGWSAILELPALLDEEQGATELIAKDGVVVHPGAFFELRPSGRLVISLLTEPALMRTGLEHIGGRFGPAS